MPPILDGRRAWGPWEPVLSDSSGHTRVRFPRGHLRRKGFRGPLFRRTQGLLPQAPAGRLAGKGRRNTIPATGMEKRGRHGRNRGTERQGRKQRARRHDGEGESRREKREATDWDLRIVRSKRHNTRSRGGLGRPRRRTPPIGPVFSFTRFLLCTFCKEIPTGIPARPSYFIPLHSRGQARSGRVISAGRRAEETLLLDAGHVDLASRKDRGRAHRPDVCSAHGKRGPVRLVDVNLKVGGQAVAFAEGPQRDDQVLLALIGAAGEVFGPPGPNVRNAVKKRVGHAAAAIGKGKGPPRNWKWEVGGPA